MRLRIAAAAWAVTAAAAMAVVAAPAHGEQMDRFPEFTAHLDTTYGQLRELTERSMGDRLDPRMPLTLVVYGGERDRYPLADPELRTLADGGKVPGVEHLASMDRLGDDETFSDTQNGVVYKIGRMIRGWLFTVVRPEKNYHVYCYTDGREVHCTILTPI